VGKTKAPRRVAGFRRRTLRGDSWTGPPLVERRALAFDSTCSHRPSRLAARRAMPLFGLDTGCPASTPRHRFTLTRLPEPSVLVPIGTDLAESSWGGPSSFGSSPRLRCPLQPESWCEPDRLAEAPSTPGCPVASKPFRRSPFPSTTRRWLWARSDPTAAPVSRDGRRLVVVPADPKAFRDPVRGGREHCPCSGLASPLERCGLGRSPLLTAPVGVRSPERGSVNTAQNPWSRGIFKFTGLSPKLSRYPQYSFCRPLVAHRSCTTMCTGVAASSTLIHRA
jgi:hypothetical protein